MSINLIVWAWSEDNNTPAKRKKRRITFDAIKHIWAAKGDHPSMAPFDFSEFEGAVAGKIGGEVDDCPYILERYPHSLCYNLSFSRAPSLIPVIGKIARAYGLNAAEF